VIKDIAALIEIKQNWAGVERLRGQLQLSAMVSGAQGHFPFVLANAAHNLPFIHACWVLNDALKQLEKENHFKCRSIFLTPLLEASKTALSWQDWNLIKKGVDLRNDVAHEGKLLERGECWKYIDAIKTELAAWGIV